MSINLPRLKELDAKASKDWDWSGRKEDEDGAWIPQGSTLGDTLIMLDDTYENCAHDCDFIAASRTELPRLVAWVERVELMLEGLVEYFCHQCETDCECFGCDAKKLLSEIETGAK